MPEFLETWTVQKITRAGNHKPVPITRGHYMGETDLRASPTRGAESLALDRKAVAASLCDAHYEPPQRYMPPEN